MGHPITKDVGFRKKDEIRELPPTLYDIIMNHWTLQHMHSNRRQSPSNIMPLRHGLNFTDDALREKCTIPVKDQHIYLSYHMASQGI